MIRQSEMEGDDRTLTMTAEAWNARKQNDAGVMTAEAREEEVDLQEEKWRRGDKVSRDLNDIRKSSFSAAAKTPHLIVINPVEIPILPCYNYKVGHFDF